MNIDGFGNDEIYSPSGWGYSYILSWISDATRMTPEEFANWQCIKANFKKDSQYINRYLKILENKEKERFLVETINTKSTECGLDDEHKIKCNSAKEKQAELLRLFNTTQKKIIAEIVKGTPSNKIAENCGLTEASLSVSMTDIYKKTKHLIPYGNRIKKTALYSYLFNECGFADGRSETSPDSTLPNKRLSIVCERKIEHTAVKPQMRNSVRVEQIQDSGFGKSERSETRPGESCVEPVEPPIIQDSGFELGQINDIEGKSNLVAEDIHRDTCQIPSSAHDMAAKNSEPPKDCQTDKIIGCLKTARELIDKKYKKYCSEIGDALVQNQNTDIFNFQSYTLAKDYDTACWVLSCAIKELKKECSNE